MRNEFFRARIELQMKIFSEAQHVPVNHKALEADDSEIDHWSQFFFVAGHNATQQSDIDPQLVTCRVDFDFERIHGGSHRDAVQRHVNNSSDTSYIRQG